MRKSQKQFLSEPRKEKIHFLSESEKLEVVLKHYDLFLPQEKYKTVCPFHPDKNASLQINLDKGNYFCYGCNASGNAVKFVQEMEGRNGVEIKPLQALQNINKWSKNDQKVVIDKPSNIIYNIYMVRNYYFNLPVINWYKKEVKSPSVENESYLQCKKYLKKRGYTADVLNKAGAKVNSNVYYPIIFPIMDNGIFRGYVMRTMDPEIEQQRKYMYNRGFHRVNVLAGDYGKRCGSDCVILVEGFMDMLKCKQHGIPNVVAVLGWKISQQQIEKLKKKGVKNLFCALDNDDAGDKGWRYMKSLKGFVSVQRVVYPKGIKDFGDVTDEIFKSRIEPQLIRKKFKKGEIKHGTYRQNEEED